MKQSSLWQGISSYHIISGQGSGLLGIALKNNNVNPYKNFMLDLLTYVGIAAAVIAVSGYLGFYLAQANPLIPHVEAETVMIAVMTMVTIANFLTVAIRKNDKERWQYLFYGLLLRGGYFLLLCLPGNHMFQKTLEFFYEIPHLQAQSWGLILPVGLGGVPAAGAGGKITGAAAGGRLGSPWGWLGPAAGGGHGPPWKTIENSAKFMLSCLPREHLAAKRGSSPGLNPEKFFVFFFC